MRQTTRVFTMPRVFKAHLLSSACVLAATGALLAGNALAQIAPSTVDPSQVEQRFTPQAQPQATPDATSAPRATSAVQKGAKISPFELRAVEVEGVTVYDDAALSPVYVDYVGKRVGMAEAQEIARAITSKYRADGYILSQAVVPNQGGNKGGVLKIRVVEGFVNDVIIEGEGIETNRTLITNYANKIRAMKPLNTKTLERYLLLSDDLPGITARGVIRPSKSTFGAADLVLQVKKKIIDVSWTTDNRGTKFLGEWQHQATFSASNAFGLYERTLLRGIVTSPTSELRFFDIQHEEQLGNEGTRLILSAGFTRTQPGDFLKPLEIEGDSDNYQVAVAHPFLRSRKENLNGRVIFNARNSETDILGFQIADDQVRSLRLGASYDIADSLNGVNLFDAQLSQGLDVFGATDDGLGRSRSDGEHTYTKINFDVSRIQNLPNGFSVLGAISGQYAFDALLSSEEFGLGGVGFGQAYDASELLGDHGLAGKLELRYGRGVGAKYLNDFQVYSYYDIGSVWNKNTPAGVDDRQSLADIGLGVRANFTSYLYGYAEVGLPLTRDVASEGDDDPRFFFSLTGRF